MPSTKQITQTSQSELLAHVSHELRAPLNTVLGVAELLGNSALSPEQRRHVEMLWRAGQCLLALADQLVGVPAHDEPLDPAPTTMREQVLAGVRLLVVDDSEESRTLVEAYLAGTGAVIAFAETGAAALDVMAREKIDVVLMDMRLPDAAGFDTTRALRSAERERGAAPVPVVALSADVLPSSIASSLDAGCSAYLTKPIARTKLLEAILASRRPEGHSPSPALREKFLTHRAREVLTAREALGRGDFGLLGTLGHNLRGNGATYGFPQLSLLGRRIEASALTCDRSTLGELLSQLAHVVSEAAGLEAARVKPLSGTRMRAADPSGRRARKGEADRGSG